MVTGYLVRGDKMALIENLKGRLMVALIFIALLSIVGFGLAAYISERGALTKNLRADLTSSADFKQSELGAWLQECQADAQMLAINESNQASLSQLIALEDGHNNPTGYAQPTTDEQ